jgi:hypothetical protein
MGRTPAGGGGRSGRARARADFAVVRAVAEPLVNEGRARLVWTEPTPEEPDGAVKFVPARKDAAPVEVRPGPGFVTLLVGPGGNSHEVVIDKDGVWEGQLRGGLQAVAEGRYCERSEQGRLSRRVVTMTFELPGERDIVVKHFGLDEDQSEPLGERRFPGY